MIQVSEHSRPDTHYLDADGTTQGVHEQEFSWRDDYFSAFGHVSRSSYLRFKTRGKHVFPPSNSVPEHTTAPKAHPRLQAGEGTFRPVGFRGLVSCLDISTPSTPTMTWNFHSSNGSERSLTKKTRETGTLAAKVTPKPNKYNGRQFCPMCALILADRKRSTRRL